MKKKHELEILRFLKESKDIFNDVFPLIHLKNGNYGEYVDLLNIMIKEGYIELKEKSEIAYLRLTKRGHLIKTPVLVARIRPKGEKRLSRASRLLKHSGLILMICAVIRALATLATYLRAY